MRHFDFLNDADTERLFHRPPQPIVADGIRNRLAVGLGATLYMPATRAEPRR